MREKENLRKPFFCVERLAVSVVVAHMQNLNRRFPADVNFSVRRPQREEDAERETANWEGRLEGERERTQLIPGRGSQRYSEWRCHDLKSFTLKRSLSLTKKVEPVPGAFHWPSGC